MKYFFEVAVKVLSISVCIMTVVVLLVAGWIMWHPPQIERASYSPYYSAQEYKRLIKKHGKIRVIIQEGNQVPYYYDDNGRKCKLM